MTHLHPLHKITHFYTAPWFYVIIAIFTLTLITMLYIYHKCAHTCCRSCIQQDLKIPLIDDPHPALLHTQTQSFSNYEFEPMLPTDVQSPSITDRPLPPVPKLMATSKHVVTFKSRPNTLCLAPPPLQASPDTPTPTNNHYSCTLPAPARTFCIPTDTVPHPLHKYPRSSPLLTTTRVPIANKTTRHTNCRAPH